MSKTKPTQAAPTKSKPINLINWITDVPLCATDKAVLLALGRHVGNKDNIVWPSQARIGRMAGVRSEAHVSRVLHRLAVQGYIKIEKRKIGSNNGYRRPNSYKVQIGHIPKPKLAPEASGKAAHMLPEQMPSAQGAYEVTKVNGPNKNFKGEGEIPPITLPGELVPVGQIPNTEENYEKEEGNFETVLECEVSDGFLIALEACVWWDLVGHIAEGRMLVGTGGETLSKNIKLRIELSRLCACYSPNIGKSWKSISAFWHKAGRLFFPKLPKFGPSHKITHLQMKALSKQYGKWGPRACYITGQYFSKWPSDKDDEPKYPSIEHFVEFADVLQDRWIETLKNVVYDDEERMTAILERLTPELLTPKIHLGQP